MWGAIIGLAASAASSLFSKSKSDSQSGIAGANAEAMQKEADYQRYRTSILLKRHEQYTHQVLGAQRAAYAKSGIQVDTGTALNVAEATDRQAAEDADIIRREGEINVERALSGASMYQQQASDIRRSGYIQAGSTILTGAWDFAKSFF